MFDPTDVKPGDFVSLGSFASVKVYVMLNPLEREQLLRRWDDIERELDRIGDLAAGPIDPAEREQRLLETQDVIECLFAWHFAQTEADPDVANPAERGEANPGQPRSP